MSATPVERAGTDVPQAYLTYPASAGEPPAQLVAFQPVTLAPHGSKAVSLFVPWTSFRAFIGGAWTTVPGPYLLSVGESSSDLELTVPVVPADNSPREDQSGSPRRHHRLSSPVSDAGDE